MTAGLTRWGNLSTVQTRQQQCKSDKRQMGLKLMSPPTIQMH